MTRIVEVVPYNPDWPRQFTRYQSELQPLFGDNLISIHHIGSTAVWGLAAKPIIDIMPLVHDINQVDALTGAMAIREYIAKGENGIPGRRYFRLGSDQHHLVHVHTYESTHPEVQRHFDFRDYLRAHPVARTAYAQLKQELAVQFRTDPPTYTNAKTEFIRQIETEAQKWRLLTNQ